MKANTPELARLGAVSNEWLSVQLADIFEPPSARLEKIADQLAATGEASGQTVAELRHIVDILAVSSQDDRTRDLSALSEAAEVLGLESVTVAANNLTVAVGLLRTMNFESGAGHLADAAGLLESIAIHQAAENLIAAANILGSLDLANIAEQLRITTELSMTAPSDRPELAP